MPIGVFGLFVRNNVVIFFAGPKPSLIEATPQQFRVYALHRILGCSRFGRNETRVRQPQGHKRHDIIEVKNTLEFIRLGFFIKEKSER